VTVRKRTVAARAFVKEIRDSNLVVKENRSDPKSPTIVLSPLAANLSRVFVVGVLLEKDEVKPDSGIYRLRVSDPTGSISAYVSNYQPVAMRQIMNVEPPCFVTVVGRVRTFERDGRVITVIRPEYIAEVDADVRGVWMAETLKATLERLEAFKNGSVPEDVRNMVLEHYGDRTSEYEEVVEKVKDILREEYIIEAVRNEDEPEEDELEEILGEDTEYEDDDFSELLTLSKNH
jgi:RPA family protein